MNKAVFITGASSGIGRALALEFAARGYDLGLAARQLDRLLEVKQIILARHPDRRVEVRGLDISGGKDVAGTMAEVAGALDGLDIVIANAGVVVSNNAGTGGFATDRNLIETNVIGTMATVDAAVEMFRGRGRGQVVVVSSISAFHGVPGFASYSASKAAIARYAEGVRMELRGTSIKVTTLFPGFIDTPMSQTLKDRPFLISAEKGAKVMAAMIERRVVQRTVPVWPWSVVIHLVRMIPDGLLAKSAQA